MLRVRNLYNNYKCYENVSIFFYFRVNQVKLPQGIYAYPRNRYTNSSSDYNNTTHLMQENVKQNYPKVS